MSVPDNWMPDDASDTCTICTKAWSFTNKRHHCRKCGRLVCASCSSHKLTLDEDSGKKERVCDTCVDEMSVEKQRIIAGLKAEVEQLTKSLQSTNMSLTKTEDEHATTKAYHEETKQELDSHAKEINRLKGDFDLLEQHRDKIDAEHTRTKNAHKSTQDELYSARADIDRLSEESAMWKDKYEKEKAEFASYKELAENKEKKSKLAFEMAEIEAKEKASKVNKDLRLKLSNLMDINEMYNSAGAELTQSVNELNDYLTANKKSISGGETGTENEE